MKGEVKTFCASNLPFKCNSIISIMVKGLVYQKIVPLPFILYTLKKNFF